MADWSNVVEILSAILHGSSLEAIPDLCRVLNKRSYNILNHSDEYEEYFSCLVALSAHSIGLNASSCADCLPHALSACNVILKFCLAQIKKQKNKLLSKKNLVSIIEGLCKGHGCLDRTEVTMFMSPLKKEMKEQPSVSTTTPEQFDFYEKLTGTFEHGAADNRPFSRYEMFGMEDELVIDAKAHLSNGNVSTLREMQGGKVLLDLCVSLPNISQFMALRGMEDAQPSMRTINSLTSSSMQSFSSSRVHELASEINLICSIASIPVMEPLNSYRLNKIALLALGCVDIAMYAASGHFVGIGSDEGNYEEIAKQLVRSSLSVVDIISHVLATSHRAGGHVVQNFNLLVSHCILKGLASLLNLESSTGMRTKEKEVNKLKRPHGLNVLLVEVSKKVISILSSLLEYLKLEGGGEESETNTPPGEMNIEVQVSAWERVKQLLKHVPLTPLLMKLFTYSYNKANVLIESVSQTSGTSKAEPTKLENDVEPKSNSVSEDPTENDSMFGHLFETEIQDQESSKSTLSGQDDSVSESPWKPEGKRSSAELYLEMSRTVLVFISEYMLNKGQAKLILNVQKTFQSSHLNDLASLVQDLDSPKNHVKKLDTYAPFNRSLNRYLHVLLDCGVLSEQQQEILLNKLSLSPDCGGHWPLYIGTRSLSILARVLLRKQKKRHRSLLEMDDPSCVKIWEELIHTLKDNAASNDKTSPDLNVEQLQLLLVVWHNFTKDQRDKILVLCIRALHDISKDAKLSDKVPLYSLRLLLIVDYMLHQSHGPPKELYTQVQYNLFKTGMGGPIAHADKDCREELRPLYFRSVEREAKASKKDGLEAALENNTPRFYGVRPNDGNQDKLEDEEVRSLLFTMDDGDLNYQTFYETLITLLSAGSNCDILMRKKAKLITLFDAKVVRCMFGMCWRLLMVLFTPVSFVRDLHQKLFLELESTKDLGALLVRLYWCAKLCVTDSHAALKETLMLQNMTESDANVIISGISTRASDVAEVVKESTWYLQQILDKHTSREDATSPDVLPSLLAVVTLDGVLTRVYVMLRDLPSIADADINIKNEIQKLFPLVLDFIKVYQAFARFSLLFRPSKLNEEVVDAALENEDDSSLQEIAMYSKVIKIGSSAPSKLPFSPMTVITGLPLPVQGQIEKWNSSGTVEFLPLFSPDHILNEGVSESPNFIYSLLSTHMKVMSFRFPFSLDSSIRHVIQSMVHLISYLLVRYPKEEGSIHSVFKKEVTDAIVPLTVDASAEFLAEQASSIIENVFSSAESEDFMGSIQQYLLENCFELMIEHSLSERPVLCEDVLIDSQRLIESLLERPQGRTTLQRFYQDNDKFVRLLLLSANQNFSLSFVHRMLKLVYRTLEMSKPPTGHADCKDKMPRCAQQAAYGNYCNENREFMEEYCRKSCKFCENREPQQPKETHLKWAAGSWGLCKKGIQDRTVRCKHSCGGKSYYVEISYCKSELGAKEPVKRRACV